jgi:two-component system, OmpR family, sensor histidine kinase PrrB
VRPLSLRTRVAAAAALGAVVIAAVVAAVLVVLLSHREVAALDRRVIALSTVLSARGTLDAAGNPADLVSERAARPLLRGLANGLVVTVRDGHRVRSVGTAAGAPDLPPVDGAARAGGKSYRVATTALPGGRTLTVGLPTAATEGTVARVRRDTVLVALAAAAGSAALGWLFAGRAIRPLRTLRDRTAALSGRPAAVERAALTQGPVRAAVETAELADALGGLLDRVEAARAEGEQALEAARVFAAAASHELRTPLTTLRTDLDVLRAHPDLPAAERATVLAELHTSQDRLEATLTALGQLAAGDLADREAAGPVDLADVAAQSVEAARRALPPGVTLTAELPDGEVPVVGSEAGLRLAVDNLITNALRHSGGSRVLVTVGLDQAAGRLAVLVDDDGRGVPAADRERLFGRFARGSTKAPGSGLGLALVAQQARLHGGHAWLGDSPLGGARAVLEVPVRR